MRSKLHYNECCLCFSAANFSGFLCQPCFQALEPDEHLFLLDSSIDFAFCSYRYAPPLSHWLIALKDQRQLGTLAKLKWLMLQQQPQLSKVDAITYIPSDTLKILQRGFNPAELLARHIAQKLQLPVYSNALIKTNSLDQRGLSKRQRQKNVKQSLLAGQLNLNEQHILIIEDVLTTGATAIAAAKALKRQGARKVSVWALAHTPLR